VLLKNVERFDLDQTSQVQLFVFDLSERWRKNIWVKYSPDGIHKYIYYIISINIYETWQWL
jgi:hypothetical protein